MQNNSTIMSWHYQDSLPAPPHDSPPQTNIHTYMIQHRRRRIFIQPPEMVDWPKWQKSCDLHANMPLYSVPSSYLLSTAPESIKLNNVPLIIPNLLLKYESDMMLILLKQIMFNWLANAPTLLSKSTCATYRGTAGSCVLYALWFILCGQPTFYYPKSACSSLACSSSVLPL